MTTSVVRPASGRLRVSAPAFGIVLLLLVAGGVRMARLGGEFVTAYPRATLTSVLLFALLAVPFWLVVAELDFLEREPVRLRVIAFAWGGLVATSVSIRGGAALENIVAKLGSPHLAADWGAAIAGPTVEEIAKILGVVAIVLMARSQINSVLDGVVYGAMVGLGFQIAENIVFAVGAVALAGQGDQIQPVITTFLLRGFLSGVWSHTLFGALAGAGIGYLVVRRDLPRALWSILSAWAAHVLWNSPLLTDGPGNGVLALLAVILLKGLPPLLLVLWLVRRLHDRESDYYASRLATLRDPTLITEGELHALRSGSRRASARRLAPGPARSAVRRLQRAQARLGVELSRASAAGVEHWSSVIRRERVVLARLGHPEAIAGPVSWRHTASTVLTTVVAIAVLWVALSALGGA
ncbi:PrsW family intramembrane metalloprotease [Actinoplanes sp. NPDC049596]|uniref:PrsW family intramembrane metalloprotease n=1 Tax=unclassified Actinoplanes TaxID=2626549 RepID=UPI00342BE0EC